ncbi:MAG: ABC transporter substrate-binding protein [Thiolinea sp.]
MGYLKHLNNKFRRAGPRLGLGLLTILAVPGWSAEPGISADRITLGTVLDLEGRSRELGQNMLLGMQAALKGQSVGERKLELVARNDSYTPDKTAAATQALIEEGVFLFIGNVGTPTAQMALPLLAENQIPALGFFTGSNLLRGDKPLIINYRANYQQETQRVIENALEAGVKPTEICAYVQNDAYGMSGIEAVSAALEGQQDVDDIQTALKEILAMEGDNPMRNGVGPVGVYMRNTFRSRDGYDSLKSWEKTQNTQCRLVVTVGSYTSVGHFIAYAQSKDENWTYSAVSFTGATSLLGDLNRFGIKDRVMITQVVPPVDLPLTLVAEARRKLKDELNLVSLEGFIVGKLLLHGFKQMEQGEQELTRANFLAAFQGQRFDLDGLKMDFSDDNQGSDFVSIARLKGDTWVPMTKEAWRGWYHE